ncbi:MAG TPA: diiron oxygenase [Blastocatellia bacterium]|nr:diiron oxygenase [Blastocatellia bacterium]
MSRHRTPEAERQPLRPAGPDVPQRLRLPLDRINRHADERGVAVGRLRFDHPIDRTRLFTSPGLAPLAYSPVFAELSPEQQRRYNQLVGLLQNELIGFFEQEVGGRVLPAALRSSNHLSPELSRSVRRFLEEEKQHTQMFRRLNHLAEPDWYRNTDYYILQLGAGFLFLFRRITSRPGLFPMLFWMMLLMEERSLLMSKRYAAAEPGTIEPQFLEAYLAHAEDEVRHVQIDWHLLERFYQRRPAWQRKWNARLLEGLLAGLFLKPRRANIRLVDLLIAEFPDLRPMRRRLVQAAYELAGNVGYRHMMYSPEATPISYMLFAASAEFARLQRRLFVDDHHAPTELR